ncbi:hypothetical protein HDU76_011464 [Blyttiomyces sp. JEL0837]|nr:hypothetical protein HDU76_011464 [Blyttiomyces sp. JEL0837]
MKATGRVILRATRTRLTGSLLPTRSVAAVVPLSRSLTTGSPRVEQQQHNHANNRLFVAGALAIGLGAGLAAKSLSDRWFISADAAPIKDAPLNTEEDKEKVEDAAATPTDYVDPDTKTSVPLTLELEYKDGRQESDEVVQHTFHLIGAGVRQVTALYFNVYVAAIYADAGAIAGVKHSSKWKKSYSPSAFLKGADDAFFMRDFVRRPNTELTFVLQPVRQTTGTHLKQGFTKFLNDRLAKDVKSKQFTPEQKLEAEGAIKELESKFPVGPIQKDNRFFFTKKADGSLRIAFEGRELAVIHSRWLSERFFEGYLSHEKPISSKLRSNVAAGLEKIVKS